MKLFYALLLTIPVFSNVDHKSEYIDTYLLHVSNHMQEKTEILQYIHMNPQGTYIDIGTGGDAVAILAENIAAHTRPTLIAADIDPLVIEYIKKRRPDIQKYINSTTGPKIELVTMSATDMRSIQDSTIAGIGASALAHEIFSYVPAKSSLDQFVEEICRVLEKQGVFIYRDPKWVDDPYMPCTMTIQRDIAKYYTIAFLTKFLDRTYTLIRDYKGECSKPSLYSMNHVYIHIYNKHVDQLQRLCFADFFSMPSTHFDYTKEVIIEASKGLLAECQRHYLMFAKDYYAAAFIDTHLFQNNLAIDTLDADLQEILLQFANTHDLSLEDHTITKDTWPLYCKEELIVSKLFNEGCILHLDAHKILPCTVHPNLLTLLDEHTVCIDPKLLILLFQGNQQGFFTALSQDDFIPWDLLTHLKLEGEEHYFYKTTDEIITHFGQFSRHILKDTSKDAYLLAPISAQEIREAPRDFYKTILQRDFLLCSACGEVQEPVTEKNLIHFALQPESSAFAVYLDILRNHTNRYPELHKWMSHVFHRND